MFHRKNGSVYKSSGIFFSSYLRNFIKYIIYNIFTNLCFVVLFFFVYFCFTKSCHKCWNFHSIILVDFFFCSSFFLPARQTSKSMNIKIYIFSCASSSSSFHSQCLCFMILILWLNIYALAALRNATWVKCIECEMREKWKKEKRTEVKERELSISE